MIIAVTLTFDPLMVLGGAPVGQHFGCGIEGLEEIAKQFPPEVQFCGHFFRTGETKEIRVFDTYEVREAGTNWRGASANELVNEPFGSLPEKEIGYATHIVGEWDIEQNKNLLFKFDRCMFTGHIWSGVPCDCNKMAANVFTPHELGAVEHEEGSLTTHQGVTIAWKRVKEEKVDETSIGRTDGCHCGDDDRVRLDERW
jgi:hypothetical protein